MKKQTKNPQTPRLQQAVVGSSVSSDEILFVKRTNRVSGCRTYNNPVIKMEYPNGRFLISQRLAEILNVDNDNGLMFGFNQKAKTAYVVKDDEEDAFILRRKDKNSLRFCSKDLQNFFVDTFELLETGKSTFYFSVSDKPNDKVRFYSNQNGK